MNADSVGFSTTAPAEADNCTTTGSGAETMGTTTETESTESEVPEGFFDEVASLLETETAEEVADAVITVCIRRGILHPELEEDPSDELRVEQLQQLFALLDRVTAAVADGSIVPSSVPVAGELDPQMAPLWFAFAAEAADPEAAAAVEAMLATGTLV